MTKTSKRRAVGIARVSRVGDRGGETFVSPDEQRGRIRDACERNGLRLVDIYSEMDVSGGLPLERRPGLSRAVALVEAGKADVIVVAYFDRLVRNLRVQLDVIERIEAAGGEILTLDHGSLTNGNAVQQLSSTLLGAVAEYVRVATSERTAEAKVRAVARGVPPFPNLPFYLRRRGKEGDGPLEHVPEMVPVATEAVRMRAAGATIKSVQEYLRENGVELSYHGVQTVLASRMLLGELRYGESVNLDAFPPVVNAETWRRAQAQRLPRGRRSVSDRLLARLGVLRCGTCNARMTVGTTRARGKTYWLYKCPPPADCSRRVSISAAAVEEIVATKTVSLLAGMKGKASAASGAEEAAREYEQRQAEFDAAMRVTLGAGIKDESAAQDQLVTLREARDEAAERLEELCTIDASLVVDPEADWDLLTLEERRALVRAVVARVVVAPGRGPERVTVEPLA
jgi:site-specific DNA recombinase